MTVSHRCHGLDDNPWPLGEESAGERIGILNRQANRFVSDEIAEVGSDEMCDTFQVGGRKNVTVLSVVCHGLDPAGVCPSSPVCVGESAVHLGKPSLGFRDCVLGSVAVIEERLADLVADHLRFEILGPDRLEQISVRQAQQEVAKASGDENTGVENYDGRSAQKSSAR